MKTKRYKVISIFVLVSVVFSMLAGCGQEIKVPYVLPEHMEVLESQTVAENANLELKWDNDRKCILLVSKASGKIWSTTAYKNYTEGKDNALLSSPISAVVADLNDHSLNNVQAYSAAIQPGTLSVKAIADGMEIIYYLDDYSISIPVTYHLREDSLAVTLDNTLVRENDRFHLVSVSVSPMMCSVPNDTEDSYLFVPAGTGAVMSTEFTADGTRTYSGEVYGVDAGQTLVEKLYDQERVKLPVFGIKDGDSALLGIVEENAAGATINANAGNKITGHSNVYACINTRGVDQFETQGISSASIATLSADAIAQAKTVVGFYPLEGEQADYNGMAACYRDYLIQKGMTKSNIEQSPVGLTVVGNVMVDELFMGLPVTELKNLTSYQQTRQIIESVISDTGITPAVQMLGFGQTGTDIGEIGGGFKLSSENGSAKELRSLYEYASEKHLPLFTDFDLFLFSESGSGVSTLVDASKSASKRKSIVYDRSLILGDYDKDEGENYLLKQELIPQITDKLAAYLQKSGITGCSLETMTAMTYSDYSSPATSMKAGIEQLVTDSICSVKAVGAVVAGKDANAYAAQFLDSVFCVQTTGRNTDGIAYYVPFYQMVFKGYIPMYSEYINNAAQSRKAMLSAVASGVGLGYIVSENYDICYSAEHDTILFNSEFSANRESLAALVNEVEDYYLKIAEARILRYTVLDNGVTETIFDNGITVYTNQDTQARNSPAGRLEAMTFAYLENGGAEGA